MNENVELIERLVNGLGVPVCVIIVLFIFIFWYIKKIDEENRTKNAELTKAIQEQTVVIANLQNSVSIFMSYVCKLQGIFNEEKEKEKEIESEGKENEKN